LTFIQGILFFNAGCTFADLRDYFPATSSLPPGITTSTWAPPTRQAAPPDYVSTQRAPIVRVVKIDQFDMFANQGGLFAHAAQPGELE
jgi:hypothetical protein